MQHDHPRGEGIIAMISMAGSSKEKIVELLEMDSQWSDKGAYAEAQVKEERPDLEPGSEGFYRLVLEYMKG